MDEMTYQPLSLEHLDGLVDVHYRITTGNNLLPLMGRSAVRAFYRWWAGNPKVVAVVACCGETVVGHALGPLSPANYRQELNRAIWKDLMIGAIRVSFVHPIRLARLVTARKAMLRSMMRSVLRLHPGPVPPSLEAEVAYSTLLSIGVDPSFQGKSVARDLLAKFVAEMGRRGAKELRLTVRATNTRAIAFYNQTGWTFFDEANGGLRFRRVIGDAGDSNALNRTETGICN
jgi:GNAT superfamily N-acetyltransferase